MELRAALLPPPDRHNPPSRLQRLRRALFLLILLSLCAAVLVAWQLVRAQTDPPDPAALAAQTLAAQGITGSGYIEASPAPSSTLTPTTTPTLKPAAQQPVTGGAPSSAAVTNAPAGVVFLSMGENGYYRLFAFEPQRGALTRMMAGSWNDIHPALSPDGRWLAFASDRDGAYDLYLLEMATSSITRLTHTLEFDGSPTFSPDGKWIAHESYFDPGGLEIVIRPLDGSQEAIRLTNDPGADHSPAWAPQGRQVAFVSTRTGDADIWLADLDQVDERFRNLTRSASAQEDHPTWSPGGGRLAWSRQGEEQISGIYLLDTAHPEQRPVLCGNGNWPAWNPTEEILLTGLNLPNGSYLTAYSVPQGELALPARFLSGPLGGLAWGSAGLSEAVLQAIQPAAQWTPTAEGLAALSPNLDIPAGRIAVVPLEGVTAPSAMLQDLVDEAFTALRTRVIAETGWDFLATLENAYTPLTAPLGPGQREDWLYTGRAISVNTLAAQAGWMTVQREEFGSQTFWRIYLLARFQDGSQGQPLRNRPWNFNARYSGDTRAYEQGGALAEQTPGGYWIDFTALAAAYGWERLPALSTWRSSYPAALFNEFVHRDGLDWLAAMQQVYPHQALDTATPIPPPTETPTPTLRPTRTPYMTRTPRPTATYRPTRTPVPTNTPYGAPAATPTFFPSVTP